MRPEFGPSLPALLRPRLRGLPRAARIALAALALVVLALLAWMLAAGKGDGRAHVVVREPLVFNFFHGDGLVEATHPGEIVRLQTRPGASNPQSFAVRRLQLPAYRGDVNAYMALHAATLIEQMRGEYDGFIWRGDGRVAVNRQPGHQISFQAQIDGRKVYGRRILLVEKPTPAPREGVDILMLAAGGGVFPTVDAVTSAGQLKTPYRTFRFGTRTTTP